MSNLPKKGDIFVMRHGTRIDVTFADDSGILYRVDGESDRNVADHWMPLFWWNKMMKSARRIEN